MNIASVAPSGVDGSQLVTMIAHELSHPLVPIRNAAALLGNALHDPAAVRRAAEIIEREANNMNRLIGDLADVSRLQTGTLEMCRKRAPLVELMERAVDSAGPFVREHGHGFSMSVSPEPVYLQMDVMRLCQALHHLIANACKYTNKHGHIHVRAQRNGATASIIVSDTGIGIPASALESIFGLFSRGGHGNRAQAGLGLGLYLARHFIEAHGGTLTAASEGVNRGSEFKIELPCEISTATVPASGDEEPVVDRSPA